MGWLRWLWATRASGGKLKLDAWRRSWLDACAAPDAARVAALSTGLDELGLPEDDIEIEREMLTGLDELVRLQTTVASNGLPVLPTGHRVVGAEPCYFSVPTSMPDEPTQPSGRLIFTNTRAIFAGSARATTVPWHAVSNVLQQGRDVILVRRDREMLYRFRCNVFGDALSGAFIARRLASRPRSASPSTCV